MDTYRKEGGKQTSNKCWFVVVYLGGDGVGLTELVTPVASADRDHSHLGVNDGTTDRRGNFGRALVAQTDVTVFVTDNNESLGKWCIKV